MYVLKELRSFFSTSDYFKLTTFFDDFVLFIMSISTGADPENFSREGGPTLSKIDSVWRITVEMHKYEK